MLKQITSNRWQDEKRNYIWKDAFGEYKVFVNGTIERFATFEKAKRFYEVFK